jgi:predicted DsbA family dithiol-disulfide isomerase
MLQQLAIDVVSDVICPWCFLGKRRLDQAILMVPEIQVEVRWRPFFLDPTIPPEGIDRSLYLLNKFGSERLKTLHDPLIAAGREIGVPYEFDRITKTPNTLNAHRLIRWGGESGKQANVVEALFMAYWNEGRDIGSRDVLINIAIQNGLDGIGEQLSSDKDCTAIINDVKRAQSLGISGVPTFILAERFGISGAQNAESLAASMRQALKPDVKSRA